MNATDKTCDAGWENGSLPGSDEGVRISCFSAEGALGGSG